MLEKDLEDSFNIRNLNFDDLEKDEEPFDEFFSKINSSSSSSKSIKYHYLCKDCKKFPKINFLGNGLISWFCKCTKEKKKEEIILIKDAYNYMINIEEANEDIFKCKKHKRKYDLYCQNCKKNLCYFCQTKCYEQNHSLIHNNNPEVFDKALFIKKKIKEQKCNKSKNKKI